MHVLNLEIRTLRSPAYTGSDPVERATWINLLAFCCEQENGGRIAGAKAWSDRQWLQACGVMAREVAHATRLTQWDGEDLIVTGYPHDKEAEVRAKREAGRVGGRRSGVARAKQIATGGGSRASSTAWPHGSPGA